MIFFFILTLGYVLLLVSLTIAWANIPHYCSVDAHHASTIITVLIPVRNEEKNIGNLLQDLARQVYPAEQMEVLIIDDCSTDNTRAEVEAMSKKVCYRLELLSIPPEFSRQPNKKRAIEMGIAAARGTLVLTTDGDCRVSPEWVAEVESFYRLHSCAMICGPVFYEHAAGWLGALQKIEFAALIGTGAASMALGVPNMCNGANLAYEKKVFLEVEGYAGNREVPSGDDEFLLHKIYARYPGRVKFIKSEAAIVRTRPLSRIRDFVQQRRRWASKWGSYRSLPPKAMALFIFLYNAGLAAAGMLTLAGLLPGMFFLEQILVKLFVEFVFLRSILRFSGQRLNWIHFLLLELIYPFYVVFMALTSIRGNYRWKERNVTKNLDRQRI